MKVYAVSGHVKVTIEVNEARYNDKQISKSQGEGIRRFEQGFLQGYSMQIASTLQGSLHMGEQTPQMFEFMSDQQAQMSQTLLEYAGDIIRRTRR